MGCWTPPFGNPQVFAGAVALAELLAASRLELRCRWGKPRAPARSPRWPHLHRFGFGGFAPLPPAFPVRGRLPVMRVCRSRAPVGAAPPSPLRSPKGKARRSCAPAHGTASETAFAAMPSQISRKLLPRKRLGVPSLPSRGCAEGTLARPQRGNPKGGAALFGQSLPTFCWPESRGPARPERVEGKRKKFKRRQRRKRKNI